MSKLFDKPEKYINLVPYKAVDVDTVIDRVRFEQNMGQKITGKQNQNWYVMVLGENECGIIDDALNFYREHCGDIK